MRTTIIAAAAAPALILSGCAASAGEETAASRESASVQVPQGVTTMYRTVAEEIDEAGGETTSGEWRVGYIVEAAEPWYEHHGEHEKFRAPKADETHHIEILPFEKSTGRVVPDVPVHLEVVAEDGTVVDEKNLNFYYSTFFHYANNFSVPEPGTYSLRATLDAPTFLRHGEEGEQPALAEGTTVTFEDVELGAS